MALHFSEEEYAERQSKAAALLQGRGLDGLLMFAPESDYWICGYDTFGFALFQCLILTADGRLNLLTRAPDLRQAQQTSTLTDGQIHIWRDVEGVDPAAMLAGLAEDLGLSGGRIGIETKTSGLVGFNSDRVRDAFQGRAELIESSDLIPSLRRVKSAAEIECCRKAAKLSDDALDAALETAGPGAFEGDILAAMQGAVFRGGGDYAGNEFVLGSGPAALLCRYASGRRSLDASDQLTIEWSGTWRRYHAAMMRTLIIGPANDRQKRMHAAAVEALEACEAAIRPGNPMGDVFDAHARVFDRHGFSHARLNACGYGMGAVYNPIWVDFPMFYEGNPLLMEAGNVFFLHMILMDSDAGLAMCWGHSVLVNDGGIERLSRHAQALVEL
jgi:Xaa-Pro aminopeptidase